MEMGLIGLVGSGSGVLLGSGDWLGSASWDCADLVHCVNNLSLWISSWVVVSWCCFSALSLIGSQILAVFYSGISVLDL